MGVHVGHAFLPAAFVFLLGESFLHIAGHLVDDRGETVIGISGDRCRTISWVGLRMEKQPNETGSEQFSQWS